MLWRSSAARRLPALCIAPGSRRRTHCVRCFDNCDESVDEARCARRPQACASRRHRNRPRRALPAARILLCLSLQETPARPQRCVRAGRAAPLERREAQGSWPRAQRASSTDSSQLSERSERSERSEFCDRAARPTHRARTQTVLRTVCAWRRPGPLARAAGQSERSTDRSSEAQRPARTRLCRADVVRKADVQGQQRAASRQPQWSQ